MSEHQLRQAFIATLPGRLAALEEIYGEWGEELAPDALALMHRLSHNLAGAAGIYGFSQVGEPSQQLERALRAMLSGEEVPDSHQRKQVGVLLAVVREALLRVCSSGFPAAENETTA